MPLTLQNTDNPYVVSQEILGFRTHLQPISLQPNPKKRISVHAQTEAVKPCMKTIGENPEWWATDGRAKNGHANKLIMRFFHKLAVKVSDHCKFIVHSYNDTFYNHAKKSFDELTSDTTYTERREKCLSKKTAPDLKYIKFGQDVITYYRSGREIAHHFLRVFRHSQYLDTIVLQYHTFEDKPDLLKKLLLEFLTNELKVFDKYQRLACEKKVLAKTIENTTIFDALHSTLVQMGKKVVLLYWCSEWKDEYLFFFDKHGPCARLLYPERKSDSLAYTTPTLNLKSVKCQISSIFDRNTCNQLAQISLQDWVLLIQSSYDGTIDKYLHYAETGKDVDMIRLKKDKDFYRKLYIMLQQYYSNTRFENITYKWHVLEEPLNNAWAKKFNSVSLSKTKACFTMQNSDKKNFTTNGEEWWQPGDQNFERDREDAEAQAAIEDHRDDSEGQSFSASVSQGRRTKKKKKKK